MYPAYPNQRIGPSRSEAGGGGRGSGDLSRCRPDDFAEHGRLRNGRRDRRRQGLKGAVVGQQLSRPAAQATTVATRAPRRSLRDQAALRSAFRPTPSACCRTRLNRWTLPTRLADSRANGRRRDPKPWILHARRLWTIGSPGPSRYFTASPYRWQCRLCERAPLQSRPTNTISRHEPDPGSRSHAAIA